MADVSRRLRDAREQAGLTIKDISVRTKITAPQLQAIEAGAFGRLPGDFYTRAFLKAYAREVGLPADDIVAAYEADRAPAQPPAVPLERAAAAVPARDGARAAARRKSPQREPGPAQRQPADWQARVSRPLVLRLQRNAWAAVALPLVLVLVVAAVTQGARDRVEPGAVATSGVAEAAQSPVGTSGRAEAAPEKLILEIRPTGAIWVAAAADGNNVIYRLLQPGEHVIVEAQKEFSFRIGNAAAFSYAINGVPGKPLGGPDEVKEFEITRDNFRTYRR